ncbi:hypothetical protein M0R88_13680 [Halorussus gelatinilyticus]|uniref:Uncharacterized protein n=1 Tax=Halorussus gelatinilyticus TaxID=2937524 RepID=A0A8U0IGZ1_9EURY|nr:hypothetical protein [Halorussus gelatinilyticus]UPV99563.1 hypothetical protein M0R88_13680 [Halorussus gelatinilyticus]
MKRSNVRLRTRAALALVAGTLLAGTAFSGTAAGHGGGLRAAAGSLSVPTWLFLLTGGGVVGASFLLASFVTDRAFIRAVHGWRRVADAPVATATTLTRVVSVAALVGIIAVGFLGPETMFRNAAILAVWVGWWAGYVATVYLVGNSWPALNPWRAVAEWVPTLDYEYPERLGAWPSVAGLLALVWLEVVSPLADDPRLLAWVVVGYSVATLAGAFVFGPDSWFGSVDPVARLFRYYGRVAPLQRAESGGLELRPPGAALTDPLPDDGRDGVAFVVAILWVTTYDGFVGTPVWVAIAESLVGLGVPPVVLYPAALLAGYALFVGAWWLASRLARGTADTYLTPEAIARRFAASLLPIAAGYHLAHFLGLFVTLSPALVAALSNPLSPPINPSVVALPGWFGMLAVAFVLLGHLLAVWGAHASAYEVFPGRLQAVRSQYPFVVVMVLYTMTSLWIVSAPSAAPPFV